MYHGEAGVTTAGLRRTTGVQSSASRAGSNRGHATNIICSPVTPRRGRSPLTDHRLGAAASQVALNHPCSYKNDDSTSAWRIANFLSILEFAMHRAAQRAQWPRKRCRSFSSSSDDFSRSELNHSTAHWKSPAHGYRPAESPKPALPRRRTEHRVGGHAVRDEFKNAEEIRDLRFAGSDASRPHLHIPRQDRTDDQATNHEVSMNILEQPPPAIADGVSDRQEKGGP